MQRRTVLVGLATALGGCVGGAGTEPTDSETPTPTPTGVPLPTITDRSFTRREECPTRGDASVTTADSAVTVTGCIVGADGCKVPVLDSATYDAEADELRVVVATEDRTDADACTQALTYLGYRARVHFEGRLPGRTVVVHDGAEGRRVVADEETN